MGSQKIKQKEESTSHQILSVMRFLKNLHKEIEIAEKLEDIQDEAILNKFQEKIIILEELLKKIP